MPSITIKLKKRMLVVCIIYIVLIIGLIVRLGMLQIVQGEELRMKAYKNQTTNRAITPSRGIIYDRNGIELAVSASVDSVYVIPHEFRKNNQNINDIIQKIAEILMLDTEFVRGKVNSVNGYEDIKKKIEKDIGTEVSNYIENNEVKGIYVGEDSKRYYPYSNLAAHIIGFTGTEGQGLEGIEKLMDSYLKGTPGKIMSEVDAIGKGIPFNQERRIESGDGYNIVLTIDETIQHFTQKALTQAIADNKVINGAVGIVMNPKNGDILALASMPDYNLNEPFGKPSGLSWDMWMNGGIEEVNYLRESIWRNKAVVDLYQPGSTFKAITAAAALEENAIALDTPVLCAPVNMAGYTINCWKHGGHGPETFLEGLYNSCNPVMIDAAQRVGIDKFYEYIEAFGFKAPIGVGLMGGSTTTLFHKEPTELDMAVTSFGQQFNITPLHLATAYCAIANGGYLLKPRIVKEINDSDNNIVEKYEPEVVRKVISEETSNTLKQALEGVVTYGTGGHAYVRGYRVAGKTGTSETQETKTEGRYLASFMAFAPADDPQICVLIVLDHPTGQSHMGGQIAAPVAGALTEEILNYLEVERIYTDMDRELMMQEVDVPELRELSLKEATEKLENSKLKYIIEGDGTDDNVKIVEQMPKPDASIPQESTVILYTYIPDEELLVEIPNILNKTISEVSKALSSAGLNIKVNGMGIAYEQSYEPGTMVKKGEVIEVVFKLLETD